MPGIEDQTLPSSDEISRAYETSGCTCAPDDGGTCQDNKPTREHNHG